MPPLGDMNGGLARITSANSFQRSSCCQRVVLEDVRVGEAVQVQVHQRQPHHVGRDVVALELARQPAFFVGRQRAGALRVGVGAQDVLPGRDQKTGRAAGRVQHDLALFRVQHLDHEVDDVARRAELPGVALAAQHRQQVLEGVAQALGVVVAEFVDDFQEALAAFPGRGTAGRRS
jgi:hypothetical protein